MHAVVESIAKMFSNLLGAAEDELHQALASTQEGFRNPAPDNPVRAAELLKHADLAFLEALLKLAYKDPSRVIYLPVAMLKAVLYMRLKRISSFDKLVLTLQA